MGAISAAASIVGSSVAPGTLPPASRTGTPRRVSSPARVSSPESVASRCANSSAGNPLPSCVYGPCRNSALLNASACMPQVSLNLSAISCAAARPSPRPTTYRLAADSSSGSAADQSSAQLESMRSGSCSSALCSAASCVQNATKRAIAASDARYDFVAATLFSGPARKSIAKSAAAMSGESALLQSARTVAPDDFAAATEASKSGLRPDWEIAMNRQPRTSCGTPYTELTDGAAEAVSTRAWVSIKYLA